MGTNTGASIAQAALKYPEVDTRIYGAVAPNVDCSMFVAEVYAKSGYILPREATAQAAWFKKNGSYTTVLKDLQIGDAAHWDRGAGRYHTGTYRAGHTGNSGGTCYLLWGKGQVHQEKWRGLKWDHRRLAF